MEIKKISKRMEKAIRLIKKQNKLIIRGEYRKGDTIVERDKLNGEVLEFLLDMGRNRCKTCKHLELEQSDDYNYCKKNAQYVSLYSSCEKYRHMG